MGLSKDLPVMMRRTLLCLELVEVFDYIDNEDSKLADVLGVCLKKK